MKTYIPTYTHTEKSFGRPFRSTTERPPTPQERKNRDNSYQETSLLSGTGKSNISTFITIYKGLAIALLGASIAVVLSVPATIVLHNSSSTATTTTTTSSTTTISTISTTVTTATTTTVTTTTTTTSTTTATTATTTTTSLALVFRFEISNR
ncbi:unnamed protein product [Rotaria socialis]|uniref:Uncharacterized protein n=1 Tax=Rotaria socialis TaxID=392032 RepID=A0A821MGP8_9BILA|nr:unnamed protein product [Rotaria socialis]CAF4883771.1 unnamed protein product [Rotaria socialis]